MVGPHHPELLALRWWRVKGWFAEKTQQAVSSRYSIHGCLRQGQASKLVAAPAWTQPPLRKHASTSARVESRKSGISLAKLSNQSICLRDREWSARGLSLYPSFWQWRWQGIFYLSAPHPQR